MDWGTGLNKAESLKTKSNSWPGRNKMGKLVKKVALLCNKRRQSSVNKKDNYAGSKTAKQRDISAMLKEIRVTQGTTNDNDSESENNSDKDSM